MTDSLLYKLIIILAYVILIILVILFLDMLMKYTTRANRKEQMKNLAAEKAKETGKPLMIFDGLDHGVVITNGQTEEFNGDVTEIADQIRDNSCVLLVSEVLEYIDDLDKTVEKFRNISGGDFYTSNLEKNATRMFWDYKIKNIMDKSFYQPNDKIKSEKPNDLQLKTQTFYSYIFRVLPYGFFASNNVHSLEN